MGFKIGQKVVCVDDVVNHPHVSWGEYPIHKGQIYVIRGICPNFHHPSQGVVSGVRLEGIHRPRTDCPYRKSRFRPLVETKTSIEIFRRMLVTEEKELEVVSR